MDYGASDSSGTDDDLPPSHQNRGIRGDHVTGNGRSVNALPYSRMSNDMESQIHRLEHEAYISVLRAFKAQSDAITWEKESLITELRKELRVSDEEHRVLLTRVNEDDIIRRIREWRQAGGFQSGVIENAQPVHDSVPSPTVSASRKRQKIGQSITSHSMIAPSPALHPQSIAPTMQPSSSAAKHGGLSAAKGKKSKSSHQFPSGANKDIVDVSAIDPLIGKKVMTRWPEDNSFYEAVITDYNKLEGKHALVYDINTENETWEWVNLKEMPPQDIRWSGDDAGFSNQVAQGGAGRGVKKPVGRGGSIHGAGRGRGSLKNQPRKDYISSQNGIGKKNVENIEIFVTDNVVKEVERICGAIHPDPGEIERAKKLLKDHEQSLIDAITRLADASDGESGKY